MREVSLRESGYRSYSSAGLYTAKDKDKAADVMKECFEMMERIFKPTAQNKTEEGEK